MEREAFVFYKSYYEAAMEMPEKDRYKLYDAIIEYALFEREPDVKGFVKAVFIGIKPTISKSLARSRSGKKGGEANSKRIKNEAEANDKQNESKTEANDKQNESKTEAIKHETQDIKHETLNMKHEAVKETDAKASAKKFKKPTVEEVRTYCLERHNSVDPEAFVDFYESKGWKVGDQPMKDWRACVRTWERSESRQTYSKPDDRKGQSRGTDYDAMIAQSLKPETEAEREERKRKAISQNVQQLLGIREES